MRICSILFLLLFTATSFASGIKFTGDVRVQHEVIDNAAIANDVTRQNIRARIYADTSISDTTTVGVGLATGTTDARTTDQALGSTFDSKGIYLDTAYIKTALADVDLTLGKFFNPLKKESELFWDDSIRPEGVAYGYDIGNFTLGGGYFVTEDKVTSDPAFIVGQLSYGANSFRLATSYTTTKDVATKETYVNVNGGYAKKLGGVSLFLFGEYNLNTEASTDDTAWLAGVGTYVKGVGVKYSYREVEANGVNGLLTDADFGNGTDAKGSEITLSYDFRGLDFGGTYLFLDNGINNGTDFDKFQLDVTVGF
jgi:hypothetical protein